MADGWETVGMADVEVGDRVRYRGFEFTVARVDPVGGLFVRGGATFLGFKVGGPPCATVVPRGCLRPAQYLPEPLHRDRGRPALPCRFNQRKPAVHYDARQLDGSAEAVAALHSALTELGNAPSPPTWSM